MLPSLGFASLAQVFAKVEQMILFGSDVILRRSMKNAGSVRTREAGPPADSQRRAKR